MTSIIIVNFRCWDHLGSCLASLLAEDATAAEPLEIIVVDNDSADQRLAEFELLYPQVRFLANTGNRGFAHGCNLGARHASGDTLLFLNPDVIADPYRIERLLRVKRRHSDVAILTSRQVDGRGRPQKAFGTFPRPWSALSPLRSLMRRLRPSAFPDPRTQVGERVDCDWVSGAVLLIGAADFSMLGGFSEDFFMYMEDVDLCARARRAGMCVAYTSEVELLHNHGGSTRRDVETAALSRCETVISRHVYASKHLSTAGAWTFHALTLLNLTTSVPLALAGLLTFGRLPRLHSRARMLKILGVYYAQALRHGSWLSRRSPNFSIGEAG